MLAKSFVDRLKLGFENTLGFRVQLAPIGTDAKEIEIYKLLFGLDLLPQNLKLIYEPEPTEFRRFLLCVNEFHRPLVLRSLLIFFPIVPTFHLKVQTVNFARERPPRNRLIYKNRF